MRRHVTARHLAGRFALHFFSSCSLVLGLFLLLRWLQPRTGWLPEDPHGTPAWSAVTVVFISWLREPRDVEKGDPAWKSYVDLLNWIAGCAASYWALGALIG